MLEKEKKTSTVSPLILPEEYDDILVLCDTLDITFSIFVRDMIRLACLVNGLPSDGAFDSMLYGVEKVLIYTPFDVAVMFEGSSRLVQTWSIDFSEQCLLSNRWKFKKPQYIIDKKPPLPKRYRAGKTQGGSLRNVRIPNSLNEQLKHLTTFYSRKVSIASIVRSFIVMYMEARGSFVFDGTPIHWAPFGVLRLDVHDGSVLRTLRYKRSARMKK